MGNVRTTRIDRTPQHLPVPLGELTPAHGSRPRRHLALRVRAATTCTAVGIVATAAGVGLAFLKPTVTAYLDGNHIHIGAMTLTRVGTTLSTGAVLYDGAASYVLAERRDGSASAASSWMSGDTLMSGVCSMRAAGVLLTDECTFQTESGVETSVDVLNTSDGLGWQRTYGDGVRVVITVPSDGAVVPVPFPIGR